MLLFYILPPDPTTPWPARPHQLTAYQKESSIAWERITPAEELATLFNLPAMVLGLLIAHALFPENHYMNSLYAAAPFVPLVWYCVGRWLDGLLRHIEYSRVASRRRSLAFAVLSAVLLIESIIVATSWGGGALLGAGFVAWSGLFLAICVSSVYRSPSKLT